MAAFLVDGCIAEGRLPQLGEHARRWILAHTRQEEAAVPRDMQGLAPVPTHSLQLQAWHHILASDAWASAPVTTAGGRRIALGSYFNRAISERWAGRGKSVLRGVPRAVLDQRYTDLARAWFGVHRETMVRCAARWVRVPPAALKTAQSALFLWRANKQLHAGGLMHDVQEARACIKGMRVPRTQGVAIKSEFDVARQRWETEILAVHVALQTYSRGPADTTTITSSNSSNSTGEPGVSLP